MAVVDDQLRWRKVFQDVAASLKCTNTPDGVNAQPVVQASGVRGIWPAPSAVRFSASNYASGVQTSVIWTVTGGKKLFVSSAFLTGRRTSDGDATGLLFARDGADALTYRYLCLQWQKAEGMVTTLSYFPALEALAGWDICVSGDNAALGVTGQVNGWLEDA